MGCGACGLFVSVSLSQAHRREYLEALADSAEEAYRALAFAPVAPGLYRSGVARVGAK